MIGYKRKRGDSWRLEVTVGTDAYGKPKRYSKTVHCKSEAAADKELAKFYSECASGKVKRQNPTKVHELCDVYVDEYAKRYLKTSTLQGVRSSIRTWIKPVLGEKKVSKVTRLDVQRFVNVIADDGKSPKTVQNHYMVLRQIMNYAVDMGIIDVSPCHNIKLPKKCRHEAIYFDINDVGRLLDALDIADDLTLKSAILVLLFGGLRKGEVLGLDWPDVDFDNDQIHVHRTRMFASGRGVYEDTPKTASSVRYVALPKEVMATLRDLQLEQKKLRLQMGASYEPSDAVLRGIFGAPLHPSVLQKKFTTPSPSLSVTKLWRNG